MQSEVNRMSVVPDLDKAKCIRTMKRLGRKNADLSRIWVITKKNKDGELRRSIVLPFSYVKLLTPAMQDLVVRYAGSIRT